MADKHLDYITLSAALNWCLEAKHVRASEQARRLSIIRQFARYCQASDERTQIPPSNLLPQHSERAEPYIYSDEQLQKLINACKTLPTKGLRHQTYTTFLGLMVVTGCRLSELISLKNEDFQKDKALLIVRNTKFNKSRLLPLHPTTVTALVRYIQSRDIFHLSTPEPCNALFVSEKGTRLTKDSVRQAFIRVSRVTGLRSPSDSYGSRMHDICHTLAIKTLLNWYRNGSNVEQKIPLLSTYLGHKKPSNTYWYISGVPELMAEAAHRLKTGWESHYEKIKSALSLAKGVF